MRWVCLLFPRLALEGALRRRADPEAPFALIDGPAQRQSIRAANAAARAHGVRPGQALGFAESLCDAAAFKAPEDVPGFSLSKSPEAAPGFSLSRAPEATPGFSVSSAPGAARVDVSRRRLETAPYAPELVERWRQRLAAWAYGYSAQVSLHYPHALVFEVASGLGLFGPWPTLEARLRRELELLGFSHRLVIAPNPAAARVLVNAHDGLAVDDTGLEAALGALRLERAGLAREDVETLKRSGFRYLEALFHLPRSALARRFGTGVMRHLGELRGEWPLALDVYRPSTNFSRRFEFDRPVYAVVGLAFPLKRLLQELGVFLVNQDAGVERFRVTLELEDRSPQRVEIGLLSVQRDPETLLALTRAQLERVALEGPVMALELSAARLSTYTPARRELLDGPARQREAWAALHQRLVARLGETALKPLVEHREHRPEAAVLAAAGPRAGETRERRLRPGWLTAEPQRCEAEIIRLLAGPERIESGWWDGSDVRRDYYLAEWHDGRHAWVWRQPGQPELYLHGWFG